MQMDFRKHDKDTYCKSGRGIMQAYRSRHDPDDQNPVEVTIWDGNGRADERVPWLAVRIPEFEIAIESDLEDFGLTREQAAALGRDPERQPPVPSGEQWKALAMDLVAARITTGEVLVTLLRSTFERGVKEGIAKNKRMIQEVLGFR